jgi:hypothetical protein
MAHYGSMPGICLEALSESRLAKDAPQLNREKRPQPGWPETVTVTATAAALSLSLLSSRAIPRREKDRCSVTDTIFRATKSGICNIRYCPRTARFPI